MLVLAPRYLGALAACLARRDDGRRDHDADGQPRNRAATAPPLHDPLQRRTLTVLVIAHVLGTIALDARPHRAGRHAHPSGHYGLADDHDPGAPRASGRLLDCRRHHHQLARRMHVRPRPEVGHLVDRFGPRMVESLDVVLFVLFVLSLGLAVTASGSLGIVAAAVRVPIVLLLVLGPAGWRALSRAAPRAPGSARASRRAG